MAESHDSVRVDAILGGRLKLAQLARGHRAGTDAMLLVAAGGQAQHAIDLGSGNGTVGLALLVLGRARQVTLVERDGELASLAHQNITLNGLDERAKVARTDVAARASVLAEAGLETGGADLVLANPPFNAPDKHRPSPDGRRAEAHAMPPESFEAWTRTAARALRADGRFALIHRPEALVWLLPMLARRFGALSILPVQPRADEPAKRVLIGARLNSKAPARLLPALVLHQESGAFTSEAAAIHEGGMQLALW